MTEIIPGVFQLQIPIPNNPLGCTNVYLLRGGDGYLMIDAGFNSPEAFDAMRRQLSEIGVDPRRISQIVITHAHGDHIGLAPKLRELTGARVFLHHVEKRPRFPSGRDREAFLRQVGRWSHAIGMPPPEANALGWPGGPPQAAAGGGPWRFEAPPKPDMTLEDGQQVPIDGFNLKAVWTPGHSPGHICLYDAGNRVLFSADHVLPVTTPNIGLRPGQSGRNNPLGDYLRSLDKVKDLDVKLVLPGHEHTFNDLRRRVEEIKEHHRRRNEEILATLRAGAKTGYQVSELITWMPETGGVRFHDLDHWDRRMAVSEAIAHLEAMRADNLTHRFSRGGVVYYQLTQQ